MLPAPLCIAVLGRDGVGRGTVEAALAGAGATVTHDDVTAADVQVLVIAEALKPEDLAVARRTRPADAHGAEQSGPDRLRPRWPHGAGPPPRRPLPGADRGADGSEVGLFATAHSGRRPGRRAARADHRARRSTSTDAFLHTEHRCRRNSVPGCSPPSIGSASPVLVLALREGADVATLPAVLHRLSHLDKVVEHLAATGAAGALPAAARRRSPNCVRSHRNPTTID